MKAIFCFGTSLLAVAGGNFAAAQEVSDDTIIVTATRRAESIQDVPIAVTVVTGELAENAGVEDIRDLQQLAPTLDAVTGQSAATSVGLFIRGAGTAGDNPGFEPGVGVFIDGVFRSRAGAALAELPPIEQIEILRGPQGTLFGRNTSAGALSVSTQGPDIQPGGFIEATYGNFDETEVRGMLTGPVSDDLFLRLDANWRQRDGIIDDLNTDRSFNTIDRFSVRGQASWENDTTTLRVIADYFATDEQCCAGVNEDPGATGPVVEQLAQGVGLIGIPLSDTDEREVAYSPNRDVSEEINDWGLSAELNHELGSMTFTSITAYRDWEVTRNQDVDFSGIDRAYRDDYESGLVDFTQEFRLQGEAFDGRLDWLVGAFTLAEELTLTDRVRFGAQANAYVDALFAFNPDAGFEFFDTFGPAVPEFGQVLLAIDPGLQAAAGADPAIAALLTSPLPGAAEGDGQQADRFEVDTFAFAPFTHNIIDVTERLRLTVGLRYNYEEKEISANLDAINATSEFLLDPANALYTGLIVANVPDFVLLSSNPAVNSEFNGQYEGDRSDSEFTGTLKLAFDLTEGTTVYGGYDRGFKSGGYNLDRSGFDTTLLGGNGAQIEDLEFDAETVDAFEVGLKSQFDGGVTFNLAAFHQTFSDYQELSFVGSNFVVRNVEEFITRGVEIDGTWSPVDDLSLQFGYTAFDVEEDGANASDETDEVTHRATAAATYTPLIGNGLRGLLHLDARYVSNNELDDAALVIDEGAFTNVNGRIGLATEDQRYAVEVYAENIFDEYYNLASFTVPEQQASSVYGSMPRFYGVRARIRY